MSLLVLNNITKEYRNQAVLKGVSLRVERGERLALVGPNGAGKTTLLKIAMGLETSDGGSVNIARSVKVGYLSQDLMEVDGLEKDTALHYEQVFRVEQKLRALEQQMATHSSAVSTGLESKLTKEYSRLLQTYEAMDGYTIETKISKILVGLGLRQETLSTPLVKLSGGEKMRVVVARMLLEEPDLLILDEPTNHLDLQATEWFERFLKRFRGGILFVSHDRYFLDKIATRVAELEQGSLSVRSGNYSNFLQHKQQLSKAVSNQQKRLRWTIRNAQQIVQGLKGRGQVKASKSREKRMSRFKEELNSTITQVKKQEHLYSTAGPKLKFKKLRHVSKDIAWADKLQKNFGEVTLFSGASFHIRGGERVAIIGPNGCGKTTLINLLLGNDEHYQGFLRLGEWVKYAYMGQEVLFENEKLSLLQLILSRQDIPERAAREHLARFQFYGDELNKSIEVLSGGERVRLYLACVMLEDADCLILDEPTNHLDVPARDAVEAALQEFKGTIIAVTHDRYYLTHCVGKILEIEHGKINTFEGNYDFYKQLKAGVGEQAPDEKAASFAKGEKATSPAKNSISKQGNAQKAGSKGPRADKERQEIEAQIISLEEQIKAMEGSFDETTPSEKYQEYAEVLKAIKLLYSRWDDLIT